MTANTPSDTLPIACTLAGDDQTQRAADVARIFRAVEGVAELPDGYALRFPGDAAWAETLAAFVAFERRCCAFLTFELVFAPNIGPIWLRMCGGGEIKAFVRETFLAQLSDEQNAVA